MTTTMKDEAFAALQVTASVAPKSADWPMPDYSGVSLTKGDKPKSNPVELHWDRLHGAIDDARKKTLTAIGALDGIANDKTLSATGKDERKRELAEAAIAALEKSGSLDKAREAVNAQLEAWNKDLAPPPVDPTVASDVRRHVARLREGERLVFATRNVAEAGPAILTAPAFLSGLTPAEIEIVRSQYERTVNPSIADAKAQTLAALAHAESGYRSAANLIRARAGLDKVGNGNAA